MEKESSRSRRREEAETRQARAVFVRLLTSAATAFQRTLVSWLCCLALTTGCLTVVAAELDRHVVLITIDGFPASMFWDTKTSIPRIRMLAAQGVAAEGMRVSTPSVTWPNHTTLVTGVHPEKHSVLFNGTLVRGQALQPVSVDPRRDKSDLVAVPTVFDLLHTSGLRTAAINWPCTRNARTLDDNFPDVPDNVGNTTAKLRQELVSAGVLADGTDATFRGLNGPARDDVWTKAACYVIKQRKPHLLLFHLLNTDSVHHRYGPGSPASHTALALADVYVGQLIDALEASGILANTTVFVTADHGFATATNVLQPNVLLRRAGLFELGPTNQITKARVQVVPEGGLGMIYLNDPQTRDADRKAAIDLFTGRDGVAKIIQPESYPALGLPSPERDRGMADLVLVPKDGYAISGVATGANFVAHADLNTNLGYHGYVADNSKMNAAFVASGRGIKRRAKVGVLDNRDVAPTIAHLLGKKLDTADGRVLSEVLESAK